MDFLRELGLLALGSRLKRLSDRIMAGGQAIYGGRDLAFEPRWFPVFRLVADRGPTTIGAAARALGLTHAAVSQTVRQMVQRGVLSSRRDASDERRRVVDLTDDGRELLPRLRPLWDDIHSAARDVAQDCGADLLAVLDGLEHALEESNLAERTSSYERERARDSVQIVDFTQQTRDAFRDLNVEWLHEYFRVEPVDEETLSNPEKIILEPGGAILYAKVDGVIVGTCALQKTDDDVYELTKMAVTRGYRGRQIGKRLMQATLERARRLGARKVFLVTNSGLAPACTLYRRSGFKVVHTGPHPKYERGDLVMEMDV